MRRRVWPAVAIAAVAVAGLVALLVATHGDRKRAAPLYGEVEELTADAKLSPRILQFGDTLTADVTVTVDNRRVDPASVRVRQEFVPWRLIGRPVRTREDAGATSLVRVRYTLRCTIGPCVPPRETAPLEFDPARVTYTRIDRQPAAAAAEAPWPVLVVHSNTVASDLERPEAVRAPWKADVLTFPTPSYAISPDTLRWLLVAAGVLFGVAGIALAYLVVPRKEPVVEPEPEPEPEPDVPPLERALLLLTAEARANGAADQRRALELVAEEMEAEEEGDPKIARRARALAWSEETPTIEETSALAASVREWLALHAPPPAEEVEEGMEVSHAPAT